MSGGRVYVYVGTLDVPVGALDVPVGTLGVHKNASDLCNRTSDSMATLCFEHNNW